MGYPKPYKIPYDPWFDNKVEPLSLFKKSKETKLITIHEVMYQLSKFSHDMTGGSELLM